MCIKDNSKGNKIEKGISNCVDHAKGGMSLNKSQFVFSGHQADQSQARNSNQASREVISSEYTQVGDQSQSRNSNQASGGAINSDYIQASRDIQDSEYIQVDDQPISMMNWIQPSKRKDFGNIIWPEGGKPQVENIIRNYLAAAKQKQSIQKLVQSQVHLRGKEEDINLLFCPETEEEISKIYTGEELYRQRRMIPQGPVSVVAMFGTIHMKDLAAIDEGATQSFISKSWLYQYLKSNGDMRVISYDPKGHGTYGDQCFFTYGTVEIDVYLPTLRKKPFKLIANIVKDTTAMYSVLLGTNFIGPNGLFVVQATKTLHLASDLPDGFELKGTQVNLNWGEVIGDCYTGSEVIIAPRVTLNVVSVIQDVFKRKKKVFKPTKVDSYKLDTDKLYGFVPKQMPNWSTLAVAMSISKPQANDASIQQFVPPEVIDLSMEGGIEGPKDHELEDSDVESDVDDYYDLSFEEEQELLGLDNIVKDQAHLSNLASMVQPFEEGGESGTHSSLSTSKPNSSVMTQANSSSSSSVHQLSSSSQAESSSNSSSQAESSSNSTQVESSSSNAQPSSVSGGYHVPIQLINTGDEAIVLRAGTYLGQLHQAVETSVPVKVELGAPKHKSSSNHSSNYNSEEIKQLIEILKIDELEITQHSKDMLKELISTYANVFAKNKEEIGCVNLIKVGIDVQGHPPIRVKPYRVSPHERDIIKVEVEKMLKAGVIKPSTSAWASPVVLVPKPDGSIRFAIDYRRLNSVTRREVYPMPNIQDFLDALKGNKYFTIADGQQAYFGLPMEEDSCQYTAFICHLGQYDFLRMPFGIMNGPAYYQRLMNAVLQGMLWEECLVYLDDICVMSVTEEQHIERLEHLFERLVLAGIKLKPSKCHLLQKSIKLLGHVVDADGTRPVKAKVQSIEKMVIRNRADLHTFLGMTGYYQQYCKDYALIVQPLRKLLHGKGPFKLDLEHIQAIETLKSVLMSEPLLIHPDWEYPFEIHCDASDFALGVVLCQIIDGQEKVIGYYSRLLRNAEKNYPITQKECLSVVWGMKKLRPYLYGKPFIVRTDHAALKWLLNLKDATGRLMRWSILLQDYKFVIYHRAGHKHGNADGLSRLIDTTICSRGESQNQELSHNQASIIVSIVSAVKPRSKSSSSSSHSNNLPLGFKLDKFLHQELDAEEYQAAYVKLHKKILEEQLKDKALQSVFKEFAFGQTEERVGGIKYVIEDSLLKRIIFIESNGQRAEKPLLLIPRSLQREMVRIHHDHNLAGHFGYSKTLKRLQQYYYWSNMAQDVANYVKSCSACQRNNQKELKNALARPVIPRGPFDIVAMDCLQLPESVHGNAWVLVAIDYFTKYANTYVLRGNPSAENVLKCLTSYIGQHSLVREFRLDGGLEFTNLAMQDACEKLGIEISLVPTGHHRANGLVERLNRTFQNSLCKVLDETVHYEYWEEYTAWVTFAYNTSFHEGIQDTPFFMVYGRHAILPADSWIFKRDREGESVEIDVEAYKKHMIYRFQETYSRARKCLQAQYDSLNLKADQWKQVSYDIGE